MAGRAERKLVTVLFADLTGYTALCEQLDAEAVHEVVNPAMSALRDLVVRYGGTPSSIAGDGFNAAFGIPLVHEDDAARAVHAALTLQPWIDAFNEGRAGVRLPDIHVGVNTGEVVVEMTGDEPGDFAMSGGAINLASRLCSLAVAGQVLVGEETARLVPGVPFGPRRRRRVKGIPDLVAVREALRGLADTGRAARAGSSPFVNRVFELGVLERALEDVAVAARGSVVAVVGDPGLGKSRLVEEFLANHPESRVLRGAGTPYGHQPPLAALVDALLAAAGSSRSAAAADRAAALLALGQSTGVGRAELAPLVDLATGASDTGEVRHPPHESLEAARHGAVALLQTMAQSAPVIVVIDDMHWADPAVAGLVADAVRHPWRGPVLLVVLSRPETEPVANVTCRVDELPPEEMENLLTAVLGVRPPPYLDEVLLTRLAGNPLYLEECVRMLLESGTLRLRGRELEVRDAAQLSEVPTSLRMLIAARLDALPGDLRACIREAAVCGLTIWDSLLDTVLHPALSQLVERDLLAEDPLSDLPGARQLRFKHALIRDVAYESLARRRRAELHLQSAARLRAATTEHEHFAVAPELLAWHYEQAWMHGKQAGFRGDPEVAREAIEQLRVVGEQALVFQARGAESAYARALDILADAPDAVPGPTAARLRLGRASALLEMQQWDGVLDEVEKVLAMAPDGRARAEALLVRGLALSDQGATDAARAPLTEARLEYVASGDRRGEARVVQAEAWTWRFADFPRFLTGVGQAHDLLAEAGDERGRAQLAQDLAYAYTAIGGPVAQQWSTAAESALVTEDLRGSAAILRIQSLTALHHGRYAEAAQLAVVAGERAEECGQPWFRGDSIMTRLEAAIAVGELDLAEQLVTLLEEFASDLALERLGGLALTLGARIALRRGRLELAAQRVENARVMLARLGAKLELAGVDAAEAEILLERGDAEAAEAAARRGVAVFDEAGWLLYGLPVRLTAARAAILAGAGARVALELEEIADLAELLGARRHEALARASAVQALLLAGEPVELPPARDDDPELAAVSAENAGLLVARDGNTAAAKGHFAAAVSAWSELGESVWLRRARGWLGAG